MKIGKWLSIVVIAGMLVGGLALAFPSGSVMAQAPTPGTTAPAVKDPAAANTRLEKTYQAELKMLARQDERLPKADAVLGKIQELIDKAKANGKDPAKIQAALDQFKSKLAEAKKQHEAAAAILAKHAGFDAAGKVTDPTQARQTLQDAGKNLKFVARVLENGLRGVQRFIQNLRKVKANAKP